MEVKKKIIGLRIRERREELGLVRGALSKKIGVSIATIKYWEGGQKEPTLTNFVKLAAALKKPVRYFYKGV